LESHIAQAVEIEVPSSQVFQRVRLLDGPEATYLLGPVVYARRFTIAYSVVGSSEHFVTYHLDNNIGYNHIAQKHVTFSRRAHVSGIAHQPIAIGEAFQLPIDDSDKRGAFGISERERRELREKGYWVVPVVFKSIGATATPIGVKISHQKLLRYSNLLKMNFMFLNSLELLHERAKLIHGCISPATVMLTKRAKMLFFRSPRSALIENLSVIPLEAGSTCPKYVPREFIPPWYPTTSSPSQADDLWATQMLITWIGCPEDRFGIPASVTDPEGLWAWKVKMTEVSWECEIHGIEDPVLRQNLGRLRKAMWDAALVDLKPYNKIRSLIKASLNLLRDHEQGSGRVVPTAI
jgi:hypothetical protein